MSIVSMLQELTRGETWGNGMASEGTVAWVMYQKFCNSLPYSVRKKTGSSMVLLSPRQQWQTG